MDVTRVRRVPIRLRREREVIALSIVDVRRIERALGLIDMTEVGDVDG